MDGHRGPAVASLVSDGTLAKTAPGRADRCPIYMPAMRTDRSRHVEALRRSPCSASRQRRTVLESGERSMPLLGLSQRKKTNRRTELVDRARRLVLTTTRGECLSFENTVFPG